MQRTGGGTELADYRETGRRSLRGRLTTFLNCSWSALDVTSGPTESPKALPYAPQQERFGDRDKEFAVG
jgi:hypothetical protein